MKIKLFKYPLGHSGLGWHQISSFVECPKKYQFQTVRQIGLASEYTPDYFSYGTLAHGARAQWLMDGRRGDNWKRQIRRLAERMGEAGEMVDHAVIRDVLRDFQLYTEFWAVRPTTETLAIEHRLDPRGLVPDAPPWLHRTSRFDSVARWQRGTWIEEFKTTATGSKRVQELYSTDGQIFLMMSLWSELEIKKWGELEGVLIYPLVKGRKWKVGAPPIPIRRKAVLHGLEDFKRDFPFWVMASGTIQWNDRVEKRRTACVGKHGPCPLIEMCTRGRDGAAKYVFTDGPQKGESVMKWKPTQGKEVPPWD